MGVDEALQKRGVLVEWMIFAPSEEKNGLMSLMSEQQSIVVARCIYVYMSNNG